MAEIIPTLRQRLGGRSLYLVGMMGSGKSSTGRPLAEKLGYGFVDSDSVIAQLAGCSIPEIFQRDGEAGFRKLETQVLSAISEHHSLVVATGGGVVTRSENWGVMHQGIVIWLDVEREQLLKRLEADSTPRPLLQEADPAQALDRILNARRPQYGEADLTVVIEEETPDVVADGILQLLPNLIKDPPKQRPE
ncbi:shikimate kinase [Synechococcus sp. A15-60]|uniref:shikimate kinase n=1 Tax=Synechococcus sp. A15-60 TaxID=1050655 RepID=UPI000C3C461C|nr:shikimate kinase [Synechococcus sp. A15-60]MAN18772.1 shikimate kinase [Synechococcus sp. EAC657]MEC7249290.1 shikimate kinase [Cyanobacteriota bacterium]MEC7897804.1 shikimate kinase [Cyanobacteriota bacterium]MEC8096336.1 shikimate kinase [Cyanobacteriota bacterium]QNI49314.1 shikimate kinase [Synechococcus sp. A15-60]|tara:strand:- start:922 stop:1497 length:576 start_codon:yes stop_codon:yes gene_type:complete